jgi:siroheme synthase (precorrin-2 oxidase/ferrochelatase)
MPVNKIDRREILDVLSPIWVEKHETARRVRQRIGAVLDWAYAKGYRETEAPLRAIAKGLPNVNIAIAGGGPCASRSAKCLCQSAANVRWCAV